MVSSALTTGRREQSADSCRSRAGSEGTTPEHIVTQERMIAMVPPEIVCFLHMFTFVDKYTKALIYRARVTFASLRASTESRGAHVPRWRSCASP